MHQKSHTASMPETYEKQLARNQESLVRRSDVLLHLGGLWRKAFGDHANISRDSADGQFLEFATDLVIEMNAALAKQARTASRAQWLAVVAAILCAAVCVANMAVTL